LNAEFPQFRGSGKGEFGANAALSIKGVEPGIEFGIIRKTEFDIRRSGHEVIRRLQVARFLADPVERQSMKPACREAVINQRVAVLYDVAYIEEGEASFFRNDGGEIKIKGPELLKALNVADLEVSARTKLEKEGTIEFDDRVYVGFKEAFYVPETGTLAGSINQLKDATLDLVKASQTR